MKNIFIQVSILKEKVLIEEKNMKLMSVIIKEIIIKNYLIYIEEN